MVTARIKLTEDNPAGITFGKTEDHPGYTFYIDPKNKRIELVKGKQVGENIFYGRRWDIIPNNEHQIRFVFIDKMVEMYVDDRLAGSVAPKDICSGGMALVTNRGKANFLEVNYWEPIK